MAGVLASVVSNVNLTTGDGTIAFVHPVPNLEAAGIRADSDVKIRTRMDGTQLDEFPVEVKLNSELAPGDDQTGLVDAVLPVSAATEAIDLVIHGRVADSIRIAGSPPEVRAIQPVAVEEGQRLRLGLEFDREMEEGHTYAVQVSPDSGQTWQTVGVGLKQKTFTVDRSQFREGQGIQIRVITSNGLSTCAVTSQPLRVPPPNVGPGWRG